jgi:adenylate kinase
MAQSDEQKIDGQEIVILLGPPGSGKGTQAVRLSKAIGLPHISTGDLFRENLSKGTELGKRAKSYIDSGSLVPDALVLDMLFQRVAQPDAVKGYLLDGFPRTLPQAEALGKKLADNAHVVVLNLDVQDSVIFKRAEGRLTCKQCGNVYHRELSPPKTADVCDRCGGNLYQRPDDTPAVVAERLNVYHTQTAPLIDYYAKKGVLMQIHGENSPEDVYRDLMDALARARNS